MIAYKKETKNSKFFDLFDLSYKNEKLDLNDILSRENFEKSKHLIEYLNIIDPPYNDVGSIIRLVDFLSNKVGANICDIIKEINKWDIPISDKMLLSYLMSITFLMVSFKSDNSTNLAMLLLFGQSDSKLKNLRNIVDSETSEFSEDEELLFLMWTMGAQTACEDYAQNLL